MRSFTFLSLTVFTLLALHVSVIESNSNPPLALAPPGVFESQITKETIRGRLTQLVSEKKSPREIGSEMTDQIGTLFTQVIRKVEPQVEEQTKSRDLLKTTPPTYAVYLFGSAARTDEWVLGSDIDFIIIPGDEDSKNYVSLISEALKRELENLGFVVDYQAKIRYPVPERLLLGIEKHAFYKTLLLDLRWVAGDREVDQRVQRQLRILLSDEWLLDHFLKVRLPKQITLCKKQTPTPKELMRLIQMALWPARMLYQVEGPTDIPQMITYLQEANLLGVIHARELTRIYWDTYQRRLISEGLGQSSISAIQLDKEFQADVEITINLVEPLMHSLENLYSLFKQTQSHFSPRENVNKSIGYSL